MEQVKSIVAVYNVSVIDLPNKPQVCLMQKISERGLSRLRIKKPPHLVGVWRPKQNANAAKLAELRALMQAKVGKHREAIKAEIQNYGFRFLSEISPSFYYRLGVFLKNLPK